LVAAADSAALDNAVLVSGLATARSANRNKNKCPHELYDDHLGT
jgi:hypothetical protein